jgi:hypothetical protein
MFYPSLCMPLSYSRRPRFLVLAQYKEGVEINWDTIKNKIEAEKEKEANRPGARPYQE